MKFFDLCPFVEIGAQDRTSTAAKIPHNQNAEFFFTNEWMKKTRKKRPSSANFQTKGALSDHTARSPFIRYI